MEAAAQLAFVKLSTKPDQLVIERSTFHQALVVPDTEDGVEVITDLEVASQQGSNVRYNFRIFSSDGRADWVENAEGAVYWHHGASASESRPSPLDDAGMKPIHTEWFYDTLKKSDLSYGSTFQQLSDIRIAPWKATAALYNPYAQSQDTDLSSESYIVHPSVLDSAFQSHFSALLDAPERLLSLTFMPISIDKLIVDIDVIESQRLKVSASTTLVDRTETATDLVITADIAPVIKVKNLKMKALGNGESEGSVGKRNQFYTMSWKPDIDLMVEADSNEYFKLPFVIDEGFHLVRKLEKLSVLCIKKAVDAFTEEDVKGFKWHHQSLWRWMHHTLDLIRSGQTHYDVNWLNEGPEVLHTLGKELSDACVDGQLVYGVAGSYERILKGEVEPLEIMFQTGILQKYYWIAIGRKTVGAILTRIVDVISHKYPEGHVLEIGAGTGTSTKATLDALGGRDYNRRKVSSYTFTDVTPAFFEGARASFGEFDHYMKYRVLDIQSDPTNQGFEAGHYDLVIADNVRPFLFL